MTNPAAFTAAAKACFTWSACHQARQSGARSARVCNTRSTCRCGRGASRGRASRLRSRWLPVPFAMGPRGVRSSMIHGSSQTGAATASIEGTGRRPFSPGGENKIRESCTRTARTRFRVHQVFYCASGRSGSHDQRAASPKSKAEVFKFYRAKDEHFVLGQGSIRMGGYSKHREIENAALQDLGEGVRSSGHLGRCTSQPVGGVQKTLDFI